MGALSPLLSSAGDGGVTSPPNPDGLLPARPNMPHRTDCPRHRMPQCFQFRFGLHAIEGGVRNLFRL